MKNDLDKLKYLEIIKGINERIAMEATISETESPILEMEIATPSPIIKVIEKKSMMPIETEERLLKALKKLELKTFF